MAKSTRLAMAAWIGAAALMALAACSKSPPASGAQSPANAPLATGPAAPVVDVAVEQQKIRDLDSQWSQVMASKDSSAAAALYAEDGGIYPPDAPPAEGHDAILAFWSQITALPNASLEITSNKIDVAKSGDIAVDVGSYTLKSGDLTAPSIETGKYVVTWALRDGQWKVLTDMFSPNAPATAPAAPGASGEDMASPSPPAEGSPAPPPEEDQSTPSPDQPTSIVPPAPSAPPAPGTTTP